MKKITLIIIVFLFSKNFLFSITQKNNQNDYKLKTKGFVENKGQFYDQNFKQVNDVLYKLNTPGVNIHIRQGGFSYDTYTFSKTKTQKDKLLKDNNTTDFDNYLFQRVDVIFEGSNQNAIIEAITISDDYENYYNSPNSPEGILGVHHYEKLIVKNIYNNIDIEYIVNNDPNKMFEYNFIIHPGGKIEDIKMSYFGAPIKIKDGKILFKLEKGEMIEQIPSSWFIIDEKEKKYVDVNYLQTDKNKIGYKLNNSNYSNKTLVIDPFVNISWGTYYGGQGSEPSGTEKALDMCLNDSSDIYITGITTSPSNIATSGSHLVNFAGFYDSYLAKFNSNGNLIFGTYYGGTEADVSYSCDTDMNGNVFVSGKSNSLTGISTSGSHQPIGSSSAIAFLVKFNSNGIRQWGTYYGSSGESGYSCVTDIFGNVYLAGTTYSVSGISTSGAHQTSNNGGPFDQVDAFLVKFNNNGVRQWGTYYGGSDHDNGYSCTTDYLGNVYLVGATLSSGGLHTIATSGSHQEIKSDGEDVFIVKFNTNGIRQWGTYYGGEGDENSWSCSTDDTGNFYFCGKTESNNGIASLGSFISTADSLGVEKGFLVKLNTNGVRQWATYLPGAYGCSVDNLNNVYVVGSAGGFYNIATPYAPLENGSSLMLKFDSNGNQIWGSYFGIDYTVAFSCENNVNNEFFVVGATTSQSSIATPGSHQETLSGESDVFLAKFLDCDLGVNVNVINPIVCSGQTSEVIVTSFGGQSPVIGEGTFNFGVGQHSIIVTDDNGCSVNEEITIIAKDLLQNDVCVVTTDSATGNYNIVYWEKPINISEVDSFFIYREITTNNFQKIGAVHRDSISMYNDFTANPNSTNYKYKISVLDTCGIEGPSSIYHNSIHLQYLGLGNFQWTHYEKEGMSNPVASYNFYRDGFNTGVFVPIAAIPGGNNTYTDVNYSSYPSGKYRVDVNWLSGGVCDVTNLKKANVNTTRSNIRGNTTSSVSINEFFINETKIYPSPSSDMLNVELPIDLETNYFIYDVAGKLILQDKIKGTNQAINIQNLEKGIYFIKIESDFVGITKSFVKN